MFFIIGATAQATMLIGPLVGTYLMKKDLWLPMIVGTIFQISGFIFLLPLPETVDFKQTGVALPTDDDDSDEEAEYATINLPEEQELRAPQKYPLIRKHARRLKGMFWFILEDVNVAVLVFAAMFN